MSQTKSEKSNTSVKGLLGIANINLINLLAIPSKPFALIFDFSALLWDNLNRNSSIPVLILRISLSNFLKHKNRLHFLLHLTRKCYQKCVEFQYTKTTSTTYLYSVCHQMRGLIHWDMCTDIQCLVNKYNCADNQTSLGSGKVLKRNKNVLNFPRYNIMGISSL